MMTKADLKAEALRLRLEERKSFTEIMSLLDVSKGSLSAWLRKHPLPRGEVVERSRRRSTNASVRHDPTRKAREVSRYGMSFRTDVMDVGHKGRIAEAAVIVRLAAMGFTVYRSAFDGSRVDLLASLSDTKKVALIQVKWASLAPSSYGRPTFSVQRALGCRSSGGSQARRRVAYHPGDFDFIVGYDFVSDKAYVFSHASTVPRRNCITVTDDAEEAWEQVREFVS